MIGTQAGNAFTVPMLALLAVLLLAGCQYPRDPEGTLDGVRGGTLRVGVAEADPWVKLDGDPAGVEVELIKEFAATQDAEVEWVEGSESDLMAALEGRQLDVVLAGLTRRSVWMSAAALTRPYLTTQSVIAAPDEATAERLSEDLGGVEIAVEANSPEAAKLELDTDAVVKPVDSLAGVDGPVAVHDYLLDDLGLVRTDAELDEHEHAMAVSLGENAMLVALDRFLLDRLAVPVDEHDLLDRVEDAVERIRALDWKLQDVVVALARDLDGAPEDVLVR